MSKKELNLEKLESLGKPKVKKPEIKLDAEKAIQSIHNKSSEREREKEKLKRITIDFPFSLYVDIRKKIVLEEKTLKSYFVSLASQDLRPCDQSSKN